MALSLYQTQLQTILHDFSGTFYGSPLSQTAIINQARNRVAIQGQCIRVLPPSTGAITSIAVTAGGTGYLTPPTITFTDSTGTGATATAVLTGTTVTSVTVTNGGATYTQPSIVFSGGGGSGATAVATINAVQTVTGQEVYTFTTLNNFVSLTSGVLQIQEIFSVAVSQGTVKPVLNYEPWVSFQAYYRINQNIIQNFPAVWSQYGKGTNGSFYLYPIPSGNYVMDVDCVCLPIPLVSDSTAEAIPYPYTEAIPYYAAYLCYTYAQREDDAQRMLSEYNRLMSEANAFSTSPRIAEMYGEDGDY